MRRRKHARSAALLFAMVATAIIAAAPKNPAVAVIPYSYAILADAPIGYWKLDETSGSVATDSAGSNNGTVYDTIQGLSGIAGTAYQFTGNVGSYVAVPDAPALRISDTVTLEAWARRTRVGLDPIIEKGGDWTQGQTNYGMSLHPANEGMLYFFFDGGWRGTPGVVDSAWHHFVVVARNGDINPLFYVDGVEKPTLYSGGAPTISLNWTATSNLHIGAQIDPRWTFWGANAVDEVAIYNHALPPERVLTHYTMGTTVPSPTATATPTATPTATATSTASSTPTATPLSTTGPLSIVASTLGPPSSSSGPASSPRSESWMRLRVRNAGPTPVYNVKLTISSVPATTQVVMGMVTVDEIQPNKSEWSTDTFRLDAAPARPPERCDDVKWRAEFDDGQGGHHVQNDVPRFAPTEASLAGCGR